jgi:hypothetical protein
LRDDELERDSPEDFESLERDDDFDSLERDEEDFDSLEREGVDFASLERDGLGRASLERDGAAWARDDGDTTCWRDDGCDAVRGGADARGDDCSRLALRAGGALRSAASLREGTRIAVERDGVCGVATRPSFVRVTSSDFDGVRTLDASRDGDDV